MNRWPDLYADWLLKEGDNHHTQRSYKAATNAWFTFLQGLGVAPWAAKCAHAQQWKEHLQDKGMAPATINHRLNVCQSLYKFVIDQLHLDGYSPFESAIVHRLPVDRKREPEFLWPEETEQLLTYLESRRQTAIGARNYALILGYLLTGYQTLQLVSLQWGDLRRHRQRPGAWVIERGDGKDRTVDPLPGRVYEAILDYLHKAGRDPKKMTPEEYIFQAIATHQLGNLKQNQRRQDQASAENAPKHLSDHQVVSIVQSALRKAGIKHSPQRAVLWLRNTYAQRLYAHNKEDLETLRIRLHHKNINSTIKYVRTNFPEDPVDDFSEIVYPDRS